MPIKIRPNPAIPDHEVLRKIGGGAYGEVWLARGVTGALRAVKVVWREDFEDERGFEREFEGILKFEPISRDHPALVNILHVGRSIDGVSFYYYVMELGDDVLSGQDINPVEYEPRTLRADHHQSSGVQLETNVCIDVGLRLAEALDHLHERGLAHRDVKPSNVIFVNGRAKLADIGLVAARGQRTFVGTEGFVPPEGPGSSQADVYSLGKVLYEIATGKDRLSFPELPDEMPIGADRKRWLELNKIICDICEPRISKRKISSAASLADALRRLQRGKRRRQTGLAVWMTTLILCGFALWATWEVAGEKEWLKRLTDRPVVEPNREAQIRVNTYPQDAKIYDRNRNYLGLSNNYSASFKVGDSYYFRIEKNGFKSAVIDGVVEADDAKEPMVLFQVLENDSPPQPGERWVDHMGNPYLPEAGEHVSSGYTNRTTWERYLQETESPEDRAEYLEFSENGMPVRIVLTSEAEAHSFSKWFAKAGRKGGFLTNDHEVLPVVEGSFEHAEISERARNEGWKPFRVLVRPIPFGKVHLTTNPSGVDVFLDVSPETHKRISTGYTTDGALLIPKVRPGKQIFHLEKEGYKSLTLEIDLKEGEEVFREVTMERNLGVIFGAPWENGVGMRFAPLGRDLMVSIWETRVKDYELFLKETGYVPPRKPDFRQMENHPVVNVSREDARKYCEWLTRRELEGERIARTHVYRLPTDLEWSAMVGLKEDESISPGWRDAEKPNVYPWGLTWPLYDVVGNFADSTTAGTPGVPVDRTIPGYNDGFAFTAPVGSFPPNPMGLFDLSGNVQEWVEDDYSKLGNNVYGVLRGGGWTSFQPESLLSGARNAVPPTFQDAIYGFRVVLAKIPTKSE